MCERGSDIHIYGEKKENGEATLISELCTYGDHL